MSSKELQLRPCPFCAGEARLHMDQWPNPYGGYNRRYWIRCSHCNCCSDEAGTQEGAVQLWNRRRRQADEPLDWRDATAELPLGMEPVIVCRNGEKVEQGYKDVGDWWKVYGTRTKKVTHWTPMPLPPEKRKK